MAMFLQSVVFIQPLLPAQYRIALVCVTISDAFSNTITTAQQHNSHHLSDHSDQHHMMHEDQKSIKNKVFTNMILDMNVHFVRYLPI